ncbi:MAG: phosphotransferase family protein [Janibacter sp.]
MTPAIRFTTACRRIEDHGLTLVRAHPRRDRLHLDLTDVDGRRVIGQWLVDADTAERVAGATEAVAPGRVRLLGNHLVLQEAGADRRLTALAPLVADGAGLVVHRPERRAVVRTGEGEDLTFTKVVRPSRTLELARRMERAADVPGLRAPRVASTDEDSGSIVMSTLPGRTLHDLLTQGVPAGVGEQVGAAVRTLHAGDIEEVPGHDLAAEVATTKGLIDLARLHRALDTRDLEALDREVARAASVVAQAGPVGERRLLHRDLHDKQLLVDGDAVGMLDVDTLGAGDPALDLGNLLAHLDLRVRQGWTSPQTAAEVEDEVLAGYRPDGRTTAATVGYRTLTQARLTALYAFRPGDLDAGFP